MEAICINDSGWLQDKSFEIVAGPSYLEEVVITGLYTEKSVLFYFVAGYSKTPDDGYRASEFLLKGSIDETEFEMNYKKETA
jgi:hypothetical protein